MKSAIWIFAVLLLSSCWEGEAPVRKLSGPTMGTSFQVTWLAGPKAEALSASITEELKKVNAQMSTYDPKSEISVVNQSKSRESLSISSEFATVLKAALEINAITGGVFDVTLAPVVDLWGFGPKGVPTRLPSDRELKEFKERGTFTVTLTPPTVRKSREDLHLDLSGIAKGFGVDQVGRLLEKRGVFNYLVEIGGELRARGKKNGRPWQVAIERPESGLERTVGRVVSLGDLSMATSGDYRNFHVVEGKRASHIIDPRTLHPIHHKLASVTVLDPLCMKADALATAFMVLGEKEGIPWAEAQGLAALFILQSPTGFDVVMTPQFEKAVGKGVLK